MTPELQKVLADALVVLVPAFATWVVARLSKVTKDANAAFLKLRAHEEQLGIETRVEGGKISVTSRPNPTKISPSVDPQPLHKEGG